MSIFSEIFIRKELRSAYRKSARRFADHYREYSRINEKDFEILSTEVDNIFSSISLYEDLKAWPEIVELIQIIDEFLEIYGFWEELVSGYYVAIRSIERDFLSQGSDPKPVTWHQRIMLRSQLSLLLFRRGEYKKARLYATEAMKIAQRIKHPDLQALVSSALGAISMAQGKYGESENYFEASRSFLGGKVLKKDVLLQLRQKGVLADSQGDLDKAQEFYEERARLALEMGNKEDAAESLYNLGDIAQTKHNYEEAERLYDQSEENKQGTSAIGLSVVLSRKAKLLIRKKRFEEAKAILNQQLDIERKYGDRASLLDTLQDMASNHMDLEEIDLAKQFYEEAHVLASTLGNLPAQAFSLQGIGYVEQLQGDLSSAKDYYIQSLRAARNSGHPKILSVVLSRLALLAWYENDYPSARKYFSEVLKVEHVLNHKSEVARTFLNLGDIGRFEGKLRDAEKNYHQALNIFRSEQDNAGMADCLVSLSDVLFQKKKFAEAWELLTRALDIGTITSDVYLYSQAMERIAGFINIPSYREQAGVLAAGIVALKDRKGEMV